METRFGSAFAAGFALAALVLLGACSEGETRSPTAKAKSTAAGDTASSAAASGPEADGISRSDGPAGAGPAAPVAAAAPLATPASASPVAAAAPSATVAAEVPAKAPDPVAAASAASVTDLLHQQQCADQAVVTKNLKRADIDALLKAFSGLDTEGGKGCFQYQAAVADLACRQAGYKQATRFDGSGFRSPSDNYIYLWNGTQFDYWNAKEASQPCLESAACLGLRDGACG